MAQVKSAVRHVTALVNETRGSGLVQGRRMFSKPQPAPAQEEATRPFDQIPGSPLVPFLGLAAYDYLLPRIGIYHHAACPPLLERARVRHGEAVRLGCAGDLPRRVRRPALLLYRPRDMAQVYASGCVEPPRFVRSPLAAQRLKINTNRSAGDGAEVFSAAARTLLARSPEEVAPALEHIAARLLDRLNAVSGRDRSDDLNSTILDRLYAWALESIACAALERPPRVRGDLLRVTRHLFERAHAQRSERTLRRDGEEYSDAVRSFQQQYELCERWVEEAEREGSCAASELRPLGRQQRARVLSDLLLAGVDMLVHTSTRLLYYLALNPAKQQRLRDELAAGGGGGGGAGYARACVRESLRLHVACAVLRRSTAPLEVAGYRVPPGVDIVMAHQPASRSERQFGRPNYFIPERWTCERDSPLHAAHAHPAASCPWGAPAAPGTRSYVERELGGGAYAGQEGCAGRGLAERALVALLTRLVADRTVEWHGARAHLDTAALHYMPPPYHFVLQKA